MVTQKFSRNFASRKCEENIGEAMELEEQLCYVVVAIGEFTILGVMVSAGGGYESAMSARTGCGLVKCRECGEFMYIK